LNSSLARSAAELWLAKVCPEMANVTFCETLIFVKNCFLSHKFGSRYASRSIKGSKDADQSQFQKNLERKNGALDWRPGRGKIGQKRENIPPL